MPENIRADMDAANDRKCRPLTAAQTGIWIGQQLDPDSPAYWTAEAVELQGNLDVPRLTRAVRSALTECEALHQVFHHDGEQLWQQPKQSIWPWQIVDFAHEAPDEAWQSAQQWMQAQLQIPAKLDQGPVLASALLKLESQRHLWFLQAHHIVLDGFGFALVARRVAAWYSALALGDTAPPRAPAPLQPVLDEDEAYLRSPQFERDRDYWCEQLQNAAPPPQLTPPQPVSHQVTRARGLLPAGTLQRWQQAATRIGVDLPSWLLATVVLWLQRSSGRTDITLGVPVMGRMGSAALNVPCMLMNIAPLRVQVDPAANFPALAQQVAAQLQANKPHQRFRHEQLRADLDLRHHERRLFGPVVNIMPFDRPRRFADLGCITHPISAGPVEDLAFNIAPQGDQMRLDLEGNGLAWSEASLQQCRSDWLNLLEKLQHHGDKPLPLLDYPVALPLLRGPTLPQPAPCVVQQFRQHATFNPDRIAIEQDGAAPITYRQLLQSVQILATELQQHNAGPGSPVALLLPRAHDTIAAMLAVLWIGAAYVPLDPAGPLERQQRVLQHAQPQLLLTRPELCERIPPSLHSHCRILARENFIAPVENLTQINVSTVPAPAKPENPAYLIYTSGSTGVPNGVTIGRKSLNHFVAAASHRYRMHDSDRVLQFSPLHFDACVEEIFLSLCNGATLVLRTDAMLESVPHFLRACERQRISVLDLPTAFWHELVFCLDGKIQQLPATIRLTIIGGEAAQPQAVQRWRQQVPAHVQLLNTYGPTETTVVCAAAELHGDDTPIGTPLPGLDLLLVDEWLQPVPLGASGELCVLGPQLAQHYHDDPALTATRFVSLSCLPGAPRAYRTGDRMQRDAQGQLHFLGRIDDELKISGQRISPTEVETLLAQHLDVQDQCVLAVEREHGIRQLVAFVQPASHVELDSSTLLKWLTPQLLAAAMPQHILFLNTFPKNANGKIDRAQLRIQWQQLQQKCTAPIENTDETDMERLICNVWRTVLGTSSVQRLSDFFALGGKSLQAIQVVNRLGRELQRELAVSTLFRHTTVAALAQFLEQAQENGASTQRTLQTDLTDAMPDNGLNPVLRLQAGTGAPLFCIHPADGLSWCYLGLLQHLPGVPVYGLQAEGLTGAQATSLDDMVERYLDRICTLQPHGPYHLLGWSSGGGIAQLIAARLQQNGAQVALLAMMDAYPAECWTNTPAPTRRDAMLMLLDDSRLANADDGTALPEPELLQQIMHHDPALAALGEPVLQRMIDVTLHNMQLYRTAQHPRCDGNLLFFRAARRLPDQPEWSAWREHISGDIQIINIDSEHFGLHLPPAIGQIGAALAERLSPD